MTPAEVFRLMAVAGLYGLGIGVAAGFVIVGVARLFRNDDD